MNLRKRKVLRCTLKIAMQMRYKAVRNSASEPQAVVFLPNGRQIVVTETLDRIHHEKKIYKADLLASYAESPTGYLQLNPLSRFSGGVRMRDLYKVIDCIAIVDDCVPLVTNRGVYHDNHRIY